MNSAEQKPDGGTIRLSYPVHTLEGQEIMSAGSHLTDETLSEIAHVGNRADHSQSSLGTYSTVRDDLFKFINKQPYSRLFDDQQYVDALMEHTDRTMLPDPVLETLDYFKHNDYYTYQHILVVYAVSIILARDLLGNGDDEIALAGTGPTHDIGKICVPLGILKKHTPLTHTERKMLENHSAAGHVLLSYYNGSHSSLANIVARDHHERRDGSGHPRGITQRNIMVEIIAVADVYDALISPRAYRPISYDNRSALEVVTGMAESGQVGWDVVKALVAHNRRPFKDFHESSISSEKRGVSPPGNVYGITAED